jgi:outer membrane protein OmpA-like peptidoglycan-associated protein
MKTLLVVLTIGLLACGHHSPPTTTTSTAAPTGGGSAPEGGGSASVAAPEQKKKPGDAGAFDVKDADKSTRPSQGKLKPTATEAAVRFFVVDKSDNTPIEGTAIALTAPDGKKYYPEDATNAEGFAEVLLPIGQTYGVTYLGLGRHDVSAKVDVANKPDLNLKLTMRFETDKYPKSLVLDNVEFASGKALLIGDSTKRLDVVVEYMAHKKSVKIEIAGYTDNVGDKKSNKKLSQQRADTVRDYLVSKGIDGERIKAVGYGDANPVAPNTTLEGQQKNRRIEAHEQ